MLSERRESSYRGKTNLFLSFIIFQLPDHHGDSSTSLLYYLSSHKAQLCVNIFLQSEETHEPTGNLRLKFWQENGMIECIRSRLKSIVFREYHGHQNEFAFLMFIAENAKVLERMVVELKFGRYDVPLQIAIKMKALEGAKWASGGHKLQLSFSKFPSAWSLSRGSDFSCDDPFLCLCYMPTYFEMQDSSGQFKPLGYL